MSSNFEIADSKVEKNFLTELLDVAISETPTTGHVLTWNGSFWIPAIESGTGTVTSITAGTGIVATPDPITTTGTIAVDTGVVVIDGGNSLSASMTIGTNDTNALNLETDGNTAMTIDTSGNVSLPLGDITLAAGNSLILTETGGANTITMTAPSSISSDLNFILPADAGTNEYFLQTNGSGTLSWAEAGLFTEEGDSFTVNIYGGTNAGSSITTGIHGFYAGYDAGNSVTDEFDNVFIGFNSGKLLTGVSSSVLIGSNPNGYLDMPTQGVSIGVNALNGGGGGVNIGYSSGVTGTSTRCTGIGYYASGGNASANLTDVTSLGYEAGRNCGDTSHNTAIGSLALKGAAGINNNCTAVGSTSLTAITTGDDNSAVGYNSLSALTTGSDNIAIGSSAGGTVTTGSDNIYIGNSTTASGTGASNEIVIGNSITGKGSNTVTIGNGSATDIYFGDDSTTLYIQGTADPYYVGITASGSTTASYTLTLPVDDGDADEFLQTNGSGVLTWTSAGGLFTEDANDNIYGGTGAGSALTTGTNNFLAGINAGLGVTSGDYNVLIGDNAGRTLSTNNDLVCIGRNAGYTTNSSVSVFIGSHAGYLSTSYGHVLIGDNAGRDGTSGEHNTAVGREALSNNTSGRQNCVMGSYACGGAASSSAIQGDNVVIGFSALKRGQACNSNVIIGSNAADDSDNTTHDNNVVIGANIDLPTGADDSIIIGGGAVGLGSNTCVITQISGVNVGAVPAVLVSGSNQLGVNTSSIRFKKNVVPLDIETETILNLEPVRFTWKADESLDFGLIAEDVNEVLPELVYYNNDGEIETVLYRKISTLLLKVCREQQSSIINLESQLQETNNTMSELMSRITALENA